MQYEFTCIVTGFAAPWANVTVLVPAPAGTAVTNLVVPWEQIQVWSQTQYHCFSQQGLAETSWAIERNRRDTNPNGGGLSGETFQAMAKWKKKIAWVIILEPIDRTWPSPSWLRLQHHWTEPAKRLALFSAGHQLRKPWWSAGPDRVCLRNVAIVQN